MNTLTVDAMTGLAALALERMAFVVVEPSAERGGDVLARAVAHASIEITGSQCHVLGVSVTPGLVREVVGGMIGLTANEVDVVQHAQATVAELANVFGGELIQLLGDEAQGMTLGLPRSLDPADASALQDAAGRRGCVTVLGDAGCALSLYLLQT